MICFIGKNKRALSGNVPGCEEEKYMNWTGKITIVTGASGGIGSAICRKLASMSLMWKRYRVTVCYDAGSRRGKHL